MTFRLFVPGVPKPQGSKTSGVNRKTGKTFVREDNKGTKPWRKVMVEALQDDHGQPLAQFESAVWVRLRFVFRRPKSHPINSLPTSKALGDVDKLTRNVLDALTQARVITDDKFVTKLRDVEKVYGPNPGLHIEIGPHVPNPFDLAAELFDLPRHVVDGSKITGRVYVDEASISAWEPSVEAVVRQGVETVGHNKFAYELLHGTERDPLGATCPRCTAVLIPGDNMSGVKCSSSACDFWFCY